VFALAAAVAFLFFLKFAVYGWAVTPLWDIPDESGHYSYANDISNGKFPVLGQAKIDKEVAHSWKGPRSRPRGNWIAQHPPLYYVLDAPAIMAARAAGMDFEHRVRAARLPSALFGALSILGMILFLARVTGRIELGLAGGVFLGATPMFTHLSTGVSHDTLVACTATWAGYWVARWLDSARFAHLLYAGLLVAACTVTKITGLAMAVPLFFALAWRLWRSAADAPRGRDATRWASRVLVLWLVMFTPVCIWIAHNLVHFHQMFPRASDLRPSKTVPIGFFELMTRFPVWQHTVLNFIALVGWNGSGGALKWIQANGYLARYFLALLGAGSLAAIFAPMIERLRKPMPHAVVAVLLLPVVLFYLQWPEFHLVRWTCVLLFAALVATLAMQAPAFWRSERNGWLLFTAAATTLFLLFAYYETLRDAFAGNMRATHGRYMYPIVPFLLLVLAWPARDRRLSRVVLVATVFGMVVAEGFFLRQVISLYGQQLPA
jgi:4-amino-4-deoxy-L-arabinose transferase-like glycosyltransferase